MLQINRIIEDTEGVKEGLRKRMWTDKDLVIIDRIIAQNNLRKEVQQELEHLQSESNKVSKQIGNLYREGKRDEAEKLKSIVSESKEERKELEEKYRMVRSELKKMLLSVPNVPHASVVKGAGEEDNEVYQEYEGTMPHLPEGALPHWELAEKYNLFNLETGAKICGSGFPLFMGNGARLKRALVQYFLDQGREKGFLEVQPPLLVNPMSAEGTGQLPDKDGQMYYVNEDNFYLIPTAEVPLTNIYRDEIIDREELPIKLMGYAPCFRREAGSYGAHVKGLNRVHQFDKVEIVMLAEPADSYKILDYMCEHVGALLESLGLPYRILRLCGGDTGFTSALTYDFEVFSLAQEKWLEVSSVSNFETYQSNRLKMRYRDGNNTSLVHTLNGSALALPRIFAAIVEQYQTENGIKIPEVIQPYMNVDVIS